MIVQYVVDASIVVQNLITDNFTLHVETLFDRVNDTNEVLWVPEFCLLECTNVLWKEMRFRGMPFEQAARLAHDLTVLPLNVTPVSDLLPRALSIGLAHQLAVYDSVYLAMAERLALPLITVDQRQAAAAEALGITLKPVTDFTPESE